MKHLLCASVNRVLEAYHDGELPVEEQIVVETHLAECYLCASEAKSLRMVRDALRASADVSDETPVFASRQSYGLTATRVRGAQKPALIRVNSQSAWAMPEQLETTPPPGQPRSRLTAQKVNRAKPRLLA